ncbi:nitrogen regulation protein NR(II), partial [Candidatus Omnitrophota bacterium]
ENIKLREEIQKSEKLKAVATLAAGMAHEIKNPLTSIKTFTEYLPQKYNDPDFIEKFNKIVGGEVDRINHIVRQLLEFSRPGKLHAKETNTNKLLDETLSLLNNDFLKYGIKITRNYSRIPAITSDSAQIKQVFLNLFLNAIDSMKNGGSISVRTKQVNYDTISVEIEDAGEGIAKDDIDLIFDPFFSRKDGGTGLGLSVVLGIIKKHGGKINIKSTLGKGTTFTISLPVKQQTV